MESQVLEVSRPLWIPTGDSWWFRTQGSTYPRFVRELREVRAGIRELIDLCRLWGSWLPASCESSSGAIWTGMAIRVS